MRRLISLVIILLFTFGVANATNYYIRPGGSNDSTGTDSLAAWATMYYSGQQLSAGDTLFVMGGEYTSADALWAVSSGSDGSPIVIKAYGDSKAVFSRMQGGAWIYVGSGHDYWVIDGWGYTSPDDSLMLAYADSSVDGTVGIHLVGTASEGSVTNYASNHTITGVEISGIDYSHTVLSIGIRVRLAQHVDINSCYIHDVYYPEGPISPGNDTHTAQGGGGHGIYFETAQAFKVSDCTFERINHGAIEVENYGDGSYEYHGTQYGYIKDCVIAQEWGGGIYLPLHARYILIENCVITHCGETTTSGKPAIQVSGDHIVIRNNTIYNPGHASDQGQIPITFEAQDPGFGLAYRVDSCMMYNNTIFGSRYGFALAVKDTLDYSDTTCSAKGMVFKNNIFYGSEGLFESNPGLLHFYLYQTTADNNWCTPDTLGQGPDGDWGGNLFHNNLLEWEADTIVSYWGSVLTRSSTIEYWSIDTVEARDATAWSNNIDGDPKLASEDPDAYGDNWWYITAGSPCIDAGVIVTDTIGDYVEALFTGYGWDDSLSYNGTAPDIGAYESDISDTCCSVTPSSVAFGSLQILSTSDTTVIVSNCGDSTICLDIDLADSTQYFITSGGGLDTLAGSAACTVTVQFAPTSAGEKLDTLTFGMDSCDVVPLSGTGTGLAPCCSESQATFAFGEVIVDASEVDTLYITNCDADCTLTCNPELADSTEYWVTWVSEGWGAWTLDPSEICSLEITFAPLSSGEKLDTLIWNQDSCSAVYLSGTGVDPTPCCTESQSSFAFGLVEIDSSRIDTLFITNCDPDCTLTCNPDLADSTQYWVTWVSEGWDEWTLDPSEICSLEITFVPLTSGEKLDTLTWTQDSCAAVYLSGTGLNVADCSLSVASVTFNNTIVGSSSDQSFYVYNVGVSPCDTLELTVAETCDTFSVVAGSGAQTILDGDSLLVTVRFTPLAAQAHACTLQTGCDSCLTVPMSGTGRTLDASSKYKRLGGKTGFGWRRGFWR